MPFFPSPIYFDFHWNYHWVDVSSEINLHDSAGQKYRNYTTVLYNRATVIIRCTHVKAALHTKPPIQKRQHSVTIRSYLANRRSSRVLIPSPYHTHLHLSCIVKVGFIRCVGSSQISCEYIAPTWQTGLKFHCVELGCTYQ